MEIQRPIMVHNNTPRQESLPGKKKWRISLSRSSSSSSNNSPSKPEIPAEFLCPISGLLMADPIIVSSGHSYERSSVIASKTLGFNPISLFPNSPPDFSTVIPNLALKSAILNWCQRWCFPPPQPLNSAVAEKLVSSLMEKRCRKVSISEKELIQGIKDKPNHAATELNRKPNFFNSSSEDSITKPYSSPSSGEIEFLERNPSRKEEALLKTLNSNRISEIEFLEPNPSPEEEALLKTLNSNRISEIEEALIQLRRVTRIDEASRINLCTVRLISSLRALIVSRYTTVQVMILT